MSIPSREYKPLFAFNPGHRAREILWHVADVQTSTDGGQAGTSSAVKGAEKDCCLVDTEFVLLARKLHHLIFLFLALYRVEARRSVEVHAFRVMEACALGKTGIYRARRRWYTVTLAAKLIAYEPDPGKVTFTPGNNSELKGVHVSRLSRSYMRVAKEQRPAIQGSRAHTGPMQRKPTGGLMAGSTGRAKAVLRKWEIRPSRQTLGQDERSIEKLEVEEQ
ncbi:hypothetical protein BKA93DRAFT_750657 [Sparassis latifolia]